MKIKKILIILLLNNINTIFGFTNIKILSLKKNNLNIYCSNNKNNSIILNNNINLFNNNTNFNYYHTFLWRYRFRFKTMDKFNIYQPPTFRIDENCFNNFFGKILQ